MCATEVRDCCAVTLVTDLVRDDHDVSDAKLCGERGDIARGFH